MRRKCADCGGWYHIAHKCKPKQRDWIAYYNTDGEPWAIFLDGHHHDLRTLRSVTCKREMQKACCADDDFFAGNLTVGRWWIRDMGGSASDSEHPWEFCDAGDNGATPISGAKFE